MKKKLPKIALWTLAGLALGVGVGGFLLARRLGGSPVDHPAKPVPALAEGSTVHVRAADPTPEEAAAHPNILFVIADDMGQDANPCGELGSDKPSMPNLEALCASGVVFDNFWTNPVCSPSRATMLTGRYGFRTGVLDVGDALAPQKSIQNILADDVPVPYVNGFVGKWHLSGNGAAPNSPSLFGVQYFAGLLGGGLRNYFDWYAVEQGVTRETTQYATSYFTDKAIAWVAAQKSPWFLWLAYNAPHEPLHKPPQDLLTTAASRALSGDAADVEANPRAYYFASLEALDKEMGRLLASLAPETRANTVVIFVGDNGTPSEATAAPFSPDRAKASLYEGGIAAPLVVSGKGVTRRGVHDQTLVDDVDIPALIADLAGYNAAGVGDGMSFAAALEGRGDVGSSGVFDFSYSEYSKPRDAWTVRDASHKLIERAGGQEELYDLSADPYETRDLLADADAWRYADLVRKLKGYGEALRATKE